MRPARLAALALAGALALGPAGARAIDWSGHLALLYQRGDAWDPAGERSASPSLDFDGRLDASGFVWGPGILDWSGGIAYRRLRLSYVTSRDDSDGLTYRARVGLFENPRSRLSLVADARRLGEDFTSNAAGAFTGTRTTNAYDASLRYAAPGQPSLRLGFSALDWKELGPGRPERDRTLLGLRAGTNHGTDAFGYGLDYDGARSEGTLVSDDYDQHRVRAFGRARLGGSAEASVSDGYYLRIPTSTAATNPEVENHVFNAGVRWWAGDRRIDRTQYDYLHGVYTSPGVEERERTQQRLGHRHERQLSPSLRLYGNLDLSLAQDRLGLVEQTFAGQSAGAVLRWRSTGTTREWEVKGGPTLGLLEPSGGDVTFGYGGSAGTVVTWTGARLRPSLSYDVSFGQDVGGTQGFVLRQAAAASLDGALGASLVQARLSLLGDRSESDLFGATARRTLQLTADWRWRRVEAHLLAGLTSGIAGTTDDFSGDGLIVPAPYDSHTRNLAVSATAPLLRRLALTGRFRWLDIDAPDRPAEGEIGGSLAAEYSLGALQLSLEDRYTVNTTNGFTQKENVIFFRLMRTFGSRF
jgi:hypothetical protein